MMQIRAAAMDDVRALAEIQVAAGAAFRAVGLGWIADNPVPTDEQYLGYVRDGRAFVLADGPVPVGFVLVDLVDDAAHVEQLSVVPSHARRGLGAGLIDHVDGWAAARGLPALTLCTFRDVPWNAPYYARLGFVEIDTPGPGLAALLRAEVAFGLDPATRVAMRRPVRAA
ncbi:GNAT family N-acetyltransferase [Actinocatenispora comari]|uniref:GCN5 family N-acetyltransferase n=1 Tax=Actinocatenispora comari TaxID=2807577 RepID=A0A8J4A9G8_9ACTN|nr:GNAT family N-acetyltransferase [Actinocatenispora comari]GIL25730.1 GCN5 family N-acetyltransferase [Actinocatenispora comari]